MGNARIEQIDDKGKPVTRAHVTNAGRVEEDRPDGRQLEDAMGAPMNRWRLVDEETGKAVGRTLYDSRSEAKRAARIANGAEPNPEGGEA